MGSVTASSVATTAFTGVYYTPAKERAVGGGRSIRVINRRDVPDLRAHYRHQRAAGFPPGIARQQVVPSVWSRITITETGQRIGEP